MNFNEFTTPQEVLDATLNPHLSLIPKLPLVFAVPENLDLPPGPPENPPPVFDISEGPSVIPFPGVKRDIKPDSLADGLLSYANVKRSEDVFALTSREARKPF